MVPIERPPEVGSTLPPSEVDRIERTYGPAASITEVGVSQRTTEGANPGIPQAVHRVAVTLTVVLPPEALLDISSTGFQQADTYTTVMKLAGDRDPGRSSPYDADIGDKKLLIVGNRFSSHGSSPPFRFIPELSVPPGGGMTE